MTRWILLFLAITGIAGFVLGWIAFSSPSAKDLTNPGAKPRQILHRFALLPADHGLDRETPAVAIDTEGRVVLAWASQTGKDERTLWLARSADGGATFAEPIPYRKVAVRSYASKSRGKTIQRSTSVAPRLAVSGERIVLGWTEATGGPAVRFFVATSMDGGQNFSIPVCVHSAGAGRPSFTGLSASPEGAVACAWLDSRHQAQLPFCCVAPKELKFQTEQQVYANPKGGGVCPCCDTDILHTNHGVIVAFRNNDEGNRDICLALARGPGDFLAPVTINKSWRFGGCPHDGPSLAYCNKRVHVVWMDAHSGARRVYHASSTVTPFHFDAEEVQPQGTGEQGHPKIAAGGSTLHLVWDAAAGDAPANADGNVSAEHNHHKPKGARAVWYVSKIEQDQGFGKARAIDPRDGASQVNPSIAAGPGSICIAWNEFTETDKKVVLAHLPRVSGELP